MMKCEDIFFEKIVGCDSIYSIHCEDCMRKHYSCAVTHPHGEIFYLKHALYDVRKEIMDRPNVLSRSWHKSSYCLDMFSNPEKRKNLFDYLDYKAQQSLDRERESLRKAGLDEEQIEKEIEKSELEDNYYCEIIGRFWDYYSQYVAISSRLQTLEADEEAKKNTTPSDEAIVKVDRHDEPKYRKLFKALKQSGIVSGNEHIFLDMCAGAMDEPVAKLQWKLKSHRSKTISTISLCEFLSAIGKDIDQIKRIIPIYFGLKVHRPQIMKLNAQTRSEYYFTITSIVTRHLKSTK